MKTISFLSIAIAAVSLCACSGTTTGTGTNGNGNGGGNGPNDTGGTNGGGGSEFDALFDAPTGDATPDSLYGLWGGVMVDGRFTFDTRTRLAESTFTFATKCIVSNQQSAVAGVSARARVDETEIAILESKADAKKTGDITCRANARPVTIKRCADGDQFKKECFELAGTELAIYGTSPLDKVEMTKLSD